MHGMKLKTLNSFVIELRKSVRNDLCIAFLQDSNEQSSSAYQRRRARRAVEAVTGHYAPKIKRPRDIMPPMRHDAPLY